MVTGQQAATLVVWDGALAMICFSPWFSFQEHFKGLQVMPEFYHCTTDIRKASSAACTTLQLRHTYQLTLLVLESQNLKSFVRMVRTCHAVPLLWEQLLSVELAPNRSEPFAAHLAQTVDVDLAKKFRLQRQAQLLPGPVTPACGTTESADRETTLKPL